MTLAELRVWLDAHGFSSTALNSNVAAAQSLALNEAYRRLQGMRSWPWSENIVTAVTVAGNSNPSLAGITDLGKVMEVRQERGTNYQPMQYITPVEMREKIHLDRDNGSPVYWSYYDQNLFVWPRPDAVYTLQILYQQNLGDLADGSAPIFQDTFHDILGWMALTDMAVRERDWNLYGIAQAEYQTRLRNMEDWYGIRQSQNSTYIRRSPMWGQVGR